MITKIIMFLCKIEHKRIKKENNQNIQILSIKGNGKDYPKYLLYTEDENVYKRMDKF